MADPYASRSEPPADERATGEPPWLADVLGPGADRDFDFVVVTDPGPMPPLARLDRPMAAALRALEAAAPGTRSSERAGPDIDSAPVFLLRHGLIAGPAGAQGAVEADAGLISRALGLALGGCEWEADPDFGWELPVPPSGVGGPLADALCPRLLFARHDRVYEYAERVVATLGRWHAALVADAATAGLAEAIPWPPVPTSDAWKD